jgi:hypothetical protein
LAVVSASAGVVVGVELHRPVRVVVHDLGQEAVLTLVGEVDCHVDPFEWSVAGDQ